MENNEESGGKENLDKIENFDTQPKYRRSRLPKHTKNLIIKSLGLGKIREQADFKNAYDLRYKVYSNLKKEGVFDSLRVLTNAGDIPIDDPFYDSFLKGIENLQDHFSEEPYTLSQDYQKANDLAKYLSSKYSVSVTVLDTDADFHSEINIKKSVQEDAYFISAESPDETAKISEHLIKFQQMKFRLMIDAATAKRVEQSTANNQALSKTIDGIKEELAAQKKKPTLNRIAEILTERGIASPRGKDSKWHPGTVKRILDRTEEVSKNNEGQER